jgi:tetratricopeptide (TPR) repeat protein
MYRTNGRSIYCCLGLALAVWAAYANHFQNDFHFDDTHTILTNVFVEHLKNIPRFFTDATTFSSLPAVRAYRPIVTTSLALDFWLGHGAKPFYFHLSTFLWFLVQLVLMVFLFRRIMDAADGHPSNFWTALLAAACYGLHPAEAETVNYIIQRGDLYNTLGAVASLLCFIAFPAQRKRGWYLLPAIAAYLSKAPALIYPLILAVYVFLFEQDANPKKWKAALRTVLPALLVTAAAAILTARMTPSSFNAGASSPSLYRLTQPWVALHYFQTFFLPTGLTADSDMTYVEPLGLEALAGWLFVVLLAAAAVFTARRRTTRPISFGILWFFITLLPTSLMPLADVTNDHRMFFPFVGLVLAAVWSLRLLVFQKTARLSANPLWMRGALAVALVVLPAAGFATRERNKVWHTEESLWRDVTVKSPKNPRGWMSYGNFFLTNGDYGRALPHLEHSETLNPNYAPLQVNLALAYGGLRRVAETRQHFERALELAPDSEEAHLYFGRWLKERGRLAEAQAQLEIAVRLNRLSFNARDLLSQVYYETGNRQALDKLLEESVTLAFDQDVARRYMAERAKREREDANPETWVNRSAEYCKNGLYQACLVAAKKALSLRPDSAEAYGNMSAAYLSLKQWDEGIDAARKALALKPGYDAAQNNLNWALEHKPR